MVSIKIIIGSTRPNRFGPQLAEWFMELARDHTEAYFEIIDLKEVNLPFLDEPDEPSARNYVQAHTKEWSKIISASDGFIWVHPEYNHGVNAPLKNALDFLWYEWNDKPVALAGYGGAAGGARAAEQLRLIAAGLKMFDLRTQFTLVNYKSQLDKQGKFAPTEQQVAVARGLLEEITFWTVQLKKARAAR